MSVDATRLRALHDAYSTVLWRYVVRLTGDAASADDVVQETLLRALRSPRILAQEPDSARPWLFTVARHLVIDEARSARRRHELSTAHPPEEVTEDRVDALFESILVAEALAGIGPDHREVLVHAYYGGKSIADMARELDIPQGTVKSRLHYGLRALRLVLQEKGVTR